MKCMCTLVISALLSIGILAPQASAEFRLVGNAAELKPSAITSRCSYRLRWEHYYGSLWFDLIAGQKRTGPTFVDNSLAGSSLSAFLDRNTILSIWDEQQSEPHVPRDLSIGSGYLVVRAPQPGESTVVMLYDFNRDSSLASIPAEPIYSVNLKPTSFEILRDCR